MNVVKRTVNAIDASDDRPMTPRIESVTGAIEVKPMKSVAIGAPLAAILFAPEVAGFVIAPLLLYHFLQLVIAAPIASRLAHSPN